MKALVTGGSGFIGSTLVKALSKSGYELILLSRKKNINYDTITCNLGTDKIPESAFEDVDIVFHLAGYTHDLVNSPNKDKLYFDVNVKATIELIKLAINKGAKKFIYLSSVKAGGIVDQNKCISEKDQGVPNDIYGITKRTAEVEILKLSQASDISVSIIRPALVYGDEMKGNLADMQKKIKSGLFPPLPKTNNKRSMVSVVDLVDAILLIELKQDLKDDLFIVTDGCNYSTRDIYNILCSVSGISAFKWECPNIFFSILAYLGDFFKFIPFNSHKYKKLFGSESYSSEKLTLLGFVPKYNFSSYLNRNK